MVKKQFMWKRLVLFFLYAFIFSFHSNGLGDRMYFNNREDFFKGRSSVPVLARQCKSERKGQGCSKYDKEMLMKYILYFCGNIPENTHHINRQRLEEYISYPTLNTAFLRGWSWLNSDTTWPVCVVCFLDYPLDSIWEKNFSFCNK